MCVRGQGRDGVHDFLTLSSGKQKKKAKKQKQAAYMKKMFGNHFERYSHETWREGDPVELRLFDHLGGNVWIGRYQGTDELSADFLRITQGMIAVDPGGLFIGVAYMIDRSIVVFAPSLSGVMSVERKNIDKWQKQKDLQVNEHPDAIAAKSVVDAAIADWKAAPPESRKMLDDERAAAEIALHVTRDRVAKTMASVIKLAKKIVDAEARMKKEKKRAHQSIADFTLAFDRILWPEFGKDKRMYKKKQGGLPAWWRDKLSSMGHPGLRNKLERGATIKAKVIIDPSEACSTMLCGDCTTLANQGMNQVYLLQELPVYTTALILLVSLKHSGMALDDRSLP
jgi:hypothetical protein